MPEEQGAGVLTKEALAYACIEELSYSFLLLGVASAVPALPANIAQIETQPSGTLVTLDSNPVITVIGSAPGTLDGYTYSNWAIFAADATGSIDLFGHLPTGTTYVPAVGDAISAAGTYAPFDAIPEISTLTSIAQTSGGNSVPAAIPVTVPQMAAITPSSYNYLGHYLLLQDVVFSGASGNFPVHNNGTYSLTDLSGQNSLTLFQWASSYSAAGALGGTPVPTGVVDIFGTVDLFQGTPEFIPFSITSVTASTPEPESIGIAFAGLVVLGWLRRFVKRDRPVGDDRHDVIERTPIACIMDGPKAASLENIRNR